MEILRLKFIEMNKINTPYYAVIFTSKLNKKSVGYEEMSQKMCDLAKNQKGFLGFKSVRQELGITISYWKTLDDITSWKNNLEHKKAQNKGINDWYATYEIEICLVERCYSFN